MSDGLRLLGAILEHGAVSVLRDLEREVFIAEELTLYDFIRSHYRRYGRLPAVETIEEHTALILPESPETISYYTQRVHDRRLYGVIRSQFGSLKDQLRDFNMHGARDTIEAMRMATRIQYSASDIRNISEAATNVLREYDYAHENPGISGVPSGRYMFDVQTGGWQRGDLITYVARPEMGKCMAPETPVLRYDGSIVRIDSLIEGDLLMGPDSLPRRVQSTSTGREEMFEVTPKRGDAWRCNRSHILALVSGKNLDSVHTCGSKHYYSVDEYLSLPTRVQEGLRLWRTGVEFPEVKVPLDPYFIGLWLGDGTVGYARISTKDTEIVEYLGRFADSEGLSLVQYEKREGACPQYGISGSKRSANFVAEYVQLRCYGILGKKVPSCYKVNSRSVRLSTLAGLLDSDGYRYGLGYEILTEYYGLSEDILYLARSCGFGATRKLKYVNGVDYYRITIYGGGLSDIPCLLPRKRVVVETSREFTNSSFILRPLGDGEYFGITLDKDHLYLLGDFTVTHNTYILLSDAVQAWHYGYSVLIVTMEMTIEQIARRIISIESRINPKFIRTGTLSTRAARRLREVVDNLAGGDRLHLFSGGLKKRISDVDILVQEYQPDIVFIDGVYMVKPEGTRGMQKADAVSEVFDSLKQVGISKNIPIVVTTQFNRVSGSKGKDGSLETIAYSDAISTHSSLIVSILPGKPPTQSSRRVLKFIKGREGEGGSFDINFRFSPVDFSEVAVQESTAVPGVAGTVDGGTTDIDWMAT